MKSATVSTLAQAPMEVPDWAERGDEVRILRDGKTIARLLPVLERDGSAIPTPDEIEQHWRDHHRPVGSLSSVTGAELVSWARGES